ncbi:MAG TPA: phosphoribosylanthranilate isomerase [archaeon]|nr:phosphoribosylanthranilate isomerase [archaeon]
MRVRVKICGITRLEDALAAARLGAHAVGFVFHPPSPRYIEPASAAAIVKKLPAFLTTVGVFVDLDQETVRCTAALSGVDVVQLHGSESPEYCQGLGLKWIKSFRIGSPEDLKLLAPYGADRDFLLDSSIEGLPGGTGRTFNWEWAAGAGRYGRIILAGGLTPENVARAVALVNPVGVDVSSMVEKAPGIKDVDKMAAFINAVRNID